MNVREMRNEALGKRVAEALKSRNMDAWYVKTKGRGGPESTGADPGGQHDQYGRFRVRERVRTD